MTHSGANSDLVHLAQIIKLMFKAKFGLFCVNSVVSSAISVAISDSEFLLKYFL